MSQEPILVVEDSSVLSDLIRDLLEATGFAVVQASTSRDGLALLRERRFSVVLVEAEMPGVNGYQFLAEMKNDASLATLPALLLTSGEPDGSFLPKGVGVKDCVHKPVDPVELITRVRGALTPPGAVLSAPPSTQSNPASLFGPGVGVELPLSVQTSKSQGPGKIITVFSLKGGVGTSMIAVNLALTLQRMWNDSTVMVDLSLEAGALNILLDILPTATIDELASMNGNMTAEAVIQYLVPHKSGVSLLSAPPSPERAELLDAAMLRKTVGLLREQFDYVVIDTASNFAEHTLMALEVADHIVMPLIGDISSIRATTTAMDIFQALSISDDHVVLVFNEIFPRIGLSRKNAETSMNTTTLPLPYGGAKVVDSINLGAPVVLSDPDGPFAKAIQEIADEVSHPGGQARAAKSSDLLSRMRNKLR